MGRVKGLALLAGICAFALTACGEGGTEKNAPRAGASETPYSAAYQCGDVLVEFSISERDADFADMRIGNTSYAMKHVISASGAKYDNLGDETTVFWSKGDEAFVKIEGQDLADCHLVIQDPEEEAARVKALEQAIDEGSVRGIEWVLEDLNGKGVIDNSRVTLLMDEEGRLSGSGGCNRYTTSYIFDDGDVTIGGNIASTMMACPDALMKQERDYHGILPGIVRYSTDETRALILTGEDGSYLKFHAE